MKDKKVIIIQGEKKYIFASLKDAAIFLKIDVHRISKALNYKFPAAPIKEGFPNYSDPFYKKRVDDFLLNAGRIKHFYPPTFVDEALYDEEDDYFE